MSIIRNIDKIVKELDPSSDKDIQKIMGELEKRNTPFLQKAIAKKILRQRLEKYVRIKKEREGF